MTKRKINMKQVEARLFEHFYEVIVDPIMEEIETTLAYEDHEGGGRLQSEIEYMMFGAFECMRFSGMREDIALCLAPASWKDYATISRAFFLKRVPVLVFPQFGIDAYRVDFCAAYLNQENTVSGVAVECDGHEFHEKTKEQARRDKSRDRDLLSKGFPVMRYTGSEIWENPLICAEEVASAAFEAWRLTSSNSSTHWMEQIHDLYQRHQTTP